MPSMNQNNTTGPTYWRSLDELAETAEFRAFAEKEFPSYNPETFTGSSRRQFLKLMGASVAFGGLVGCRRWPKRTIMPNTSRPEGFVPGDFEHYATAYEMGGFAKPLLITAVDGRPVKVEGNPDHPASNGAADIYSQASILDLYDPNRIQKVLQRQGEKVSGVSWDAFGQWSADHFKTLKQKQGDGLVVLSEATSSPTVLRLRKQLQKKYPKMQWHTWEPLGRDNEIKGTEIAFGEQVRTQYHFDQADVIVSIDSDFMMAHPDALRYSREFAAGRAVDANGKKMNRLYVVEPTFTVTGTMADERKAAKPSGIDAIVSQLGDAIIDGADASDAFVAAMVKDLKAHAGKSIVIAGVHQSAQVHAACLAINKKLGNIGKTVTLSEEPADLCVDENDLADNIDTLLVLGGNPVYNAPKVIADRLTKATHKIHLTLQENETSQQCQWVLPLAHYAEAWGDARSYDGTISIVQPLIHPIYEDGDRTQGGRSVIEILSMLLGEKVTRQTGYELVKQTLKAQLPTEKQWRQALHDGFVAKTKYKVVAVGSANAIKIDQSATASDYQIVSRMDYALHDGRFANNGWLQELPDPITKVTWDNVACVSPADANKLGVKHSDMIDLQSGGQKLTLPVYVLPGHADGCITTTVGYGRKVVGPVGTGIGFDTFKLGRAGVVVSAKPTKSNQSYKLATTQDHYAIDLVGMRRRKQVVKELIREETLEQYKHPHHDEHHGSTEMSLQMFEEPKLVREGENPPEYKWGMSVDLNACNGCNACVVACQAENNIPVVGKDEVLMSREMQWIRIDRYFAGDVESGDVQAVHQPLMCQHCEDAPCEQVCPVAATVHDAEGLNVMVYNRCIGTRYCSNNCPYKVRRFNYFDYHVKPVNEGYLSAMTLDIPDTQQKKVDQVKRMQFNPQVTVRMRGVMEKCTFCTQRIQDVKLKAKSDHAEGKRKSATLADGELTPACAQTCPTNAIIFGNLNDKESRVYKLQKENARSYGILTELDVRPRTTYMKRLRNREQLAATAPKSH